MFRNIGPNLQSCYRLDHYFEGHDSHDSVSSQGSENQLTVLLTDENRRDRDLKTSPVIHHHYRPHIFAAAVHYYRQLTSFLLNIK